MPNIFERHPCFVLTSVTILAVSFLLVAAEFYARHFLPQWAPMTAERSSFWCYDALLGWSQIPDKKAKFSHPDFSVRVSINADGLRGPLYPKSRNEKKRMLVLGDSFGWGFGVEDNEVFTALLEKKHPDWEIINASVSGYGTVQEFLYYRERGVDYHPDVVMLMFYDNDFQDNVGKTSYWYNKPVVIQKNDSFAIGGIPVERPSWQQQLQSKLLGNFYLGRLLYPVLSVPLGLFDKPANAPGVAPDELQATGYVLDELAELVAARHTRLVIVQSPLSESKHTLVAGRCQHHEIACLHLDQAFRQHKGEDWHFEHDRHWNAQGHRLVAEAVDQFMSQAAVW